MTAPETNANVNALAIELADVQGQITNVSAEIFDLMRQRDDLYKRRRALENAIEQEGKRE